MRAFGRIKRLVDMLSGFEAHAMARVGYGYPNATLTRPPVGAWPDSNFELAAGTHGVHSIADQIDKDLSNLAGKTHQLRGVIRR